MATLRMQNVTKQFGRNVIAVKDFNLEVEEKEFLVLLGPSGCGKTTAMRMVAGLEEVTAGNIFIGDREVTELPPRKRNVSMIFQNYAVWPHMSVYDNIAFALKLKNLPKDVKNANDGFKFLWLGVDVPHTIILRNGDENKRVLVYRFFDKKEPAEKSLLEIQKIIPKAELIEYQLTEADKKYRN